MTIPAPVRELLERPNFVHVATLMADGAPHSVPVWAGLVDGDRVAFFTQTGSRKARNLEHDGRVAMSIVDHDEPYRSASLRAHVVETRDGDAALEVMDQLCIRHTGKPFPVRRGRLFVCAVDQASYTELPFRRATTDT